MGANSHASKLIMSNDNEETNKNTNGPVEYKSSYSNCSLQ